MRRRVLAFDLDDTLAVTKSPIAAPMADLAGRALDLYAVWMYRAARSTSSRRI